MGEKRAGADVDKGTMQGQHPRFDCLGDEGEGLEIAQRGQYCFFFQCRLAGLRLRDPALFNRFGLTGTCRLGRWFGDPAPCNRFSRRFRGLPKCCGTWA